MKVSASILSNNFKPSEIVKKLETSEVDFIHLDIMDGKFVENKTWTFSEIKKIISNTTKKLDVHLMVQNPSKYIDEYALLNTLYITFHLEAVKNAETVINQIKDYGIRPGLCISPKTNVKEVFPYLGMIDQILVMSVEPGKSGQSFLESVLYKIEALRKEIDEKGYSCIISIDGGINNETGLLAKEKGVDMLVSASYIHNDIINNVKTLKDI